MIPPGIDLRAFDARAAVRQRRARSSSTPLVTRAQGHRARRSPPARGSTSTSSIVEGVPPRRGARALPRAPTSSSTSSTPAGTACSRSRRWRSASRSSRSCTRRRSPDRGGLRLRVPIVHATKETLADALRPLVGSPEERAADRRGEPRVRRARPRPRPRRRPPARRLRSALSWRLARAAASGSGEHSAIYGARRARLADPRGRSCCRSTRATCPRPTTARSRSSPRLTAVARDRPAAGDLERVLPLLLRREGRRAAKLTVVRTSFWFTMAMATLGLVLGSCSPARSRHCSSDSGTTRTSSAPALVGLWAQMNYEQLTSLFRVEERSVAFVIASLATAHHGRRDGAPRRRSSTRARSASSSATSPARSASTSCCSATGASSSASSSTASSSARCSASACRSSRRRSRCGRSTSSTAFFVWYKGRREAGVYSAAVRIASRDHLRDGRVPDRLAGVRLLDRGRPRGAAHVRVRPHVPVVVRVVGRARARRCSRRGSSRCSRARASSAPRRASRCSPSRRASTPATPCSRSASVARGRRSSTGSSPASAPPSTSA